MASSASVQELVKDKSMIISVPQRYIHENQEPTYNNINCTTNNTSFTSAAAAAASIPLVDMKFLIEGNSNHDVEPIHNFHSICKEWGIFQVVNHGVSSSVVEKVKYEIEEFYKLPLKEKMKYQVTPGTVQGYGQTLLHSQDDQKVDWADRFYIITNPLNRRKSHLFPELPSSLRNTLESYFAELQKLAMTLLGVMGEALKMEKREMEEMFENGMQSIRMNYYPPCPKPELVVGLRPHSDATGLTVLLQVNGVDGLEVKKDGVWLPVKFQPDSLVVNIGDTLEILSNGAYKSIEHRATVNSEKERMSIAMFFNPKFEALVGPSPSLVNEENPPLFKRTPMEEFVKDFFSRKLIGRTFLEHMKIKN
ncbi:hypothetical protein LguiB_004772 [Lonicera macranthoides]